jgi:protein-S-isoprenylcysteine O-methyltransferase Ste14
MIRLVVRAFGVVAYTTFLASFACFVAFVGGVAVPRTVDDGPHASVPVAIAIDLALVLFFGIAHSVMARAWFKRALTRFVPVSAERSLYVLVASAQIDLLMVAWRPIDGAVWTTHGAVAIVLAIGCALGWALLLASSFAIDHFELFGLRQSFERPAPDTEMRTPFLYRLVRHPLYTGMLVGLWCTPTMSLGHLLLASSLTIYLLIGVRHEERDLVRRFGETYLRYQREVPMLLPLPRPRALSTAASSG